MSRDPLRVVAPFLEGCGPLEAARRLTRAEGELLALVRALDIERADLVVRAFEERAADRTGRRARGIFYTPAPVVETMLDRLPLEGRMLDPAAGAGAFLVGIVRRLGVACLPRLHACDIDAEALDAAALALEAELGAEARPAIDYWRANNAFVLDFLRDPLPIPAPDLVVGNPPYGTSTAPDLVTLFPELSGERDHFACFLLRAREVIGPSGRISLLVPDTWLSNARTARLREVLSGELERIVDFGKPFRGARDTRVHAVTVHRGRSVCEVESLRRDRLEPMALAEHPVLSSRARTGWALYRTDAEVQACARLERSPRLGDAFDVLYGMRTGNNARWVGERGVHPLVGGEDLEPYDRRWRPKFLVEPGSFSAVPVQLGRWKVGIQRIRTNSALPWRRWIEGAPLRPNEIGLDSLTLVTGRDESSPASALPDALCHLLGVLNSSIFNRWYRLAYTDVNVKPAYVREVPVPPFSPQLARTVRLRLARPGAIELERAIDRLVADAYGLSAEEILVLERGFWEARLSEFPLPSLEDATALLSAPLVA